MPKTNDNNHNTDKSIEQWLWDAACSIRGAKDAPKYKDYILPLVFAKRLCDVYDDEVNRIAQEVGGRAKAFKLVARDKKLVRFYIPLQPANAEEPVWSIIRKLADKIGEQLTTHLRSIADENPTLKGIIDRVDFNATTHGQRDISDDRLSALIEHFRDKERRKVFFKEYKELEMLHEIISPDAFLRPYLDDYATLSGIYAVVRKAYAEGVQADREFLRKTNALVQRHIDTDRIGAITQFVEINPDTLKVIREQKAEYNTKVINLVKSIEKAAEDGSDDPYLIGMAERAKAVQESFEERQKDTSEALSELADILAANERRKQEQAAKGFDGLTYFVYSTLLEAGISQPEAVSQKIRAAFVEHPNWSRSEKDLRDLRQKITFALYVQEDDLDKVTSTVDHLFTLLNKAQSGQG